MNIFAACYRLLRSSISHKSNFISATAYFLAKQFLLLSRETQAKLLLLEKFTDKLFRYFAKIDNGKSQEIMEKFKN